MWYDVSIENVRLCSDIMQLQHAMIGVNPQFEMERIARTQLTPANAIHLWPHEGTRCDLGLIDFAVVDHVLCGPARGPVMILGCVNGYSTSTLSPGGVLMNSTAYLVALQIKEKMIEKGFWNSRPKIFSGHSWGACVCQVLTYLWAFEFNTHDYKTVAFGAPKAGGPSFQNFFDPARLNLFLCARDTVPYVMPSGEEAPEAAPLITPSVMALWGRFGWANRFYILEEDLSLNISPVPTPYNIPRSAAMLQWITGIQGFQAPAHTSIHYMTQLLRYVSLRQPSPYPGNIPASVSATQTALPVPPTVPEPVEYIQQMPGQTVVQALPPPGPGIPETAYASGGAGYAVTVNGIHVGVARSRRFARRMEQRAEGLRRMKDGLIEFNAESLAAAVIS